MWTSKPFELIDYTNTNVKGYSKYGNDHFIHMTINMNEICLYIFSFII